MHAYKRQKCPYLPGGSRAGYYSSIQKYKGRLVAKGYAQQVGVDYQEIFPLSSNLPLSALFYP
jgi:hypothetical protein